MSNVIKLDEVSYFPYDDLAGTPGWEHSADVYIRLKSQKQAFEFHVGSAEVTSINRQILDAGCKFITFSSDFGSSHVVNKKHIKWLSIHAESSGNYPEIILSEDGEVEARYSRICKVDFTQNQVLWMLPSVKEDENSRTFADFSSLYSLGTRLNVKILRAIKRCRETKAEDYYHHLDDDDQSGYRRKFFDSWGCRAYLDDGSEYFQPGYSGPDVVGGIFKGQAAEGCASDEMFMRLSNHRDNTHFTPLGDIAMLECPTVFLGIDTFMRLHGKHWNHQASQVTRADECRRLATA